MIKTANFSEVAINPESNDEKTGLLLNNRKKTGILNYLDALLGKCVKNIWIRVESIRNSVEACISQDFLRVHLPVYCTAMH